MKIKVVKHVLENNNEIAGQIRQRLTEAGVLGVNFISAPGSGKTTLLENTIPMLGNDKVAVIVGDLKTSRDAERVSGMTVESVQINTGLSCHLYANQIQSALDDIDLDKIDYLFIENVGNMVCPGEFDLGENIKVVLYSITEGDDKVAKYPTIFQVADSVLLNKWDLGGVVDFDEKRVFDDLANVNTAAEVIKLSAKKGDGMEQWVGWLKKQKDGQIGREARFVNS